MKYLIICFLFISCSNNSEEELWQKAENCKINGKYDSSIYFCKEIIKKYPNGAFEAPATYLIADLAFNNTKNYNEASRYFNLFSDKYPSSELTPFAYYISGFIYVYKLNKKDSGITKYEKFLNLFPNHQLNSVVQNEITFLKTNK